MSESAWSRRSTSWPARSSTSTPIRSSARFCSSELQLPVLKKTPTGPSTDASVLQQLADEGHQLPSLLMEYREIAKLESTYIDALPAYVHPRTLRVHTSFSQTTAATGRLSSNEPNLQNIPIRRELGRDVRRGFVPRPGWLLLAADYSQIELRLLAHLSEDPAFVQAFRAGGDIHRQTAALIFDVPLDEVTKEMRGARQDDQLRDDLRTGRARPVAAAQDLVRRSEGVHREVLRALCQGARVSRLANSVRARARLRANDLQPASLHPGAARPELQHSRVRRADRAELTDSGIGGGPDQDRDDQDSSGAGANGNFETEMLLQVHDELVFEVPGDELEAAQSAREAGDGARGRAVRAARGGHGRGRELARNEDGLRYVLGVMSVTQFRFAVVAPCNLRRI